MVIYPYPALLEHFSFKIWDYVAFFSFGVQNQKKPVDF